MGRMGVCPDCGATVSKKADTCPKCGRRLKTGSCLGSLAKTVFVVFVLGCLALVGLAMLAPPRPVAPRAGVATAPPAPPAPPADADLGRRQQVFADLHRSGMEAHRAAEARYPDAQMPTDPTARKRHEAERHAFYESRKTSGRQAVLKKYGLDDAALEKIDSEGIEKRWPLDD